MFSLSKPTDIVFCCAAHILWWVHCSVVQPGEELPSVPHCDHTESLQMERWSHILTPTDLLIHCIIDISLYLMWFLVVFCDPIDSFRLIQFPAAHLCVTWMAWILFELSFSFLCCVAFISPSILILNFLVWQPVDLNFSGYKIPCLAASVSMFRAELHELCSTWGMKVGCPHTVETWWPASCIGAIWPAGSTVPVMDKHFSFCLKVARGCSLPQLSLRDFQKLFFYKADLRLFLLKPKTGRDSYFSMYKNICYTEIIVSPE